MNTTTINLLESEKQIIANALSYFATEVNQERLNHSINKDVKNYNQSVVTLMNIQGLMNKFSDNGEKAYHDIIDYGKELFFQKNNVI